MRLWVLLFWGVVLWGHAQNDEWRSVFNQGVSAYKSKDYDTADREFARALLIIKRRGANTEEHAKTLEWSARIKRQREQWVAAATLLSEAHKIGQKHLGNNNPQTWETLAALAEVRLSAGQPQYAVPLFQQLLVWHTRYPGESDNQLIATQLSLARALNKNEQGKEASELFAKAIETSRKNNVSQANLVGLLEEYAKVLRENGDPKAAEKVDEEAMGLRAVSQQALAPSNPRTEPKKPTTEFKEAQEFTRYKFAMVEKKQHTVGDQYQHSLCADPPISKNVAHCKIYWFTARSRTASDVSPLLTLRMSHYDDAASAELALGNLKGSAHAQNGINSEWNYIVVLKDQLYWLSGSCAYTQDSWNDLIALFKTHLEGANPPALKKLQCRCEGACVP